MRRLVALLFLLSVAMAQTAVSVTNVKDQAYPNDVLEFKIIFANIGIKSEEIKFAPFQTPFPSSISLSQSTFSLAPNEKKEVLLRIYVGDAKAGGYLIGVPYYESGEEKRLWLSATILNPLPAFMDVNVSIEGKKEVKIGETLNYTIKVDNPVKFVYADLKIEGLFSQARKIPLRLGMNIIPIKVSIPNTPAGDYWLNVTLSFPEGTVKTKSLKVKVLPTVHCYTTYAEEQRGFLHIWKARVENIGNAKGTCEIIYAPAPLESLFKSRATQGYVKEARGIVWKEDLAPGESAEVIYESNTLPAAILPIILSVIIFALWYLTNPIAVKKQVEAISKGGILTLSMRISVKNRGFKPIKNLFVADPLPKFIKEVRDFGTVPGEVKYRAGKRYVIWRFDEIKPGEEIILTYKVRTSVEILGGIKLPGVKVEYEFGGKARKIETKRFTVSF